MSIDPNMTPDRTDDMRAAAEYIYAQAMRIQGVKMGGPERPAPSVVRAVNGQKKNDDLREACICNAECKATEHDYPPIPDDGYAQGLEDGRAMERARIVAWLRDAYGNPRPHDDATPAWARHQQDLADAIELGAHDE